jgi:hypothetical protein
MIKPVTSREMVDAASRSYQSQSGRRHHRGLSPHRSGIGAIAVPAAAAEQLLGCFLVGDISRLSCHNQSFQADQLAGVPSDYRAT